MSAIESPCLSALVPHWHDEDGLRRLLESWPDDGRYELVVVDNGSSRAWRAPDHVRVVEPERNLGFGGAINLAATVARADLLLALNPDAGPAPGALEALVDGARRYPEAAGLAPRLESTDGGAQYRWQLKPLPRPADLLAHGLFVDPVRGPRDEPAPGTPVAQPAAAALLLRRTSLEALGGFDSGFFPAWFDDVDLGRRLADAGLTIRYWPAAVFRHGLGGSVAALGYARFLPIYYRNLIRYLLKHHGRRWSFAARAVLPFGMLGRLLLVPWRRPRRARTRAEAARGLLRVTGVALGLRPERGP